MNYEREMARYRTRAVRRRSRRGRRTSDVATPAFFTVGWVLEVAFVLMMGAWLLLACIKK